MSTAIDRPKLWIVAGPNGSGKSSLYTGSGIEDFGSSVWIINPDILAAQIRDRESLAPDVANLEAVKRIYGWLETSISTYQTVGVETVLSTEKYRALVTEAKRRGFEIRLIYVLLRTVQDNINRVRIRIAKGGHAVPEDKIIERRAKSLQQLSWFFVEADGAWIFDNTGATPSLIVAKQAGNISIASTALDEIKAIIARVRNAGGAQPDASS